MNNSVSHETVKEDIQKVAQQWATSGEGTDTDRAAQLLIQSIEVVKGRTGKPGILKMLYLNNEAASSLPGGVIEIVQKLVDEKITPEEANNLLSELSDLYSAMLVELGITPRSPKVIFTNQ